MESIQVSISDIRITKNVMKAVSGKKLASKLDNIVKASTNSSSEYPKIKINQNMIVTDGFLTIIAYLILGYTKVPCIIVDKPINMYNTIEIVKLPINDAVISFHNYLIDSSDICKTWLNELNIRDLKYTHYANKLVNNTGKIKSIANNYGTLGKIEPIIIDNDGVVLSGIESIIVAMILGIEQIPVIRKNIRILRFGVRITDRLEINIDKFSGMIKRSSKGKSFYDMETRDMFDRQSGRCPICGVLITLEKIKASQRMYRYSKVVLKTPRYLGGRPTPENKILLCDRCAHLKGDLILDDVIIDKIKNQRIMEESLNISLDPKI